MKQPLPLKGNRCNAGGFTNAKTAAVPLPRKLLLFFAMTVLSVAYAYGQAPTITSFTPASGPAGTSVTITGANFNATAASNIVFFGATMATVTAASPTSLTVTVPIGATYQPISVLNGATALAGYSAAPFACTFTPNKGSITTADIAPNVDFATGSNPFSVAIGDLDGDGKPDLAVANYSSGTVSVFRNTSASGSITASSFAAKVDFATGGHPASIAIGDLDGDGKPDLAVANQGSNKVSVFRNTASSGSITTSSFAAKVDFATGSGPNSVAIGDLDGDGKPDLAVANQRSNTVSVLRNTSVSGSITAASFAPSVSFTTGTIPYSVAIGDLDGDGKPDLAVANNSSSTVSVLRNTSASGSITASSFAAKVDFATGSLPYSIAIGDLDGDGKPDLAVASYANNTVSVFRNTANSGSITASSFAAKVDFATGNSPYSVAIGDLDGDGKPDLAVTNDGSGTVSVLRNTASSGSITASSFAANVDFTTGSGPGSVAIGDLDGDGKPDLAVANASGNKVSVLRNSPLLAPTTQATNVLFTSTTTTTTTVSWTNGNGASRAVFMFAGSSGSPAPVDLTAYNANAAFGSGDQIGTSGWYCVYNGTGASVPVTGLTAGTAYQVIVLEYNGSGSSVAYLTTAGTGNPAAVTTLIPIPAITSFSPASGAVGASVTITGANFNTTAANNIVFFGATQATVSAASATSLTVTVPAGATYAPITVLNTGTTLAAYSRLSFVPTFTPNKGSITTADIAPKVDFSTGAGSSPFSVAVGDLDGDGKPDLAVANSAQGKVAVLLNTGSAGNPGFAAAVTFTTGLLPTSVAIGDIDGDGRPDLVIANYNSNTVSVLLNTGSPGTISFAAKTDFITGLNPQSVAIGDIDGDGRPDLAVANNNSATVSVLLNTGSRGNISFAAKTDFTTGSYPVVVAIGDIDGDGRPDLAVANSGSNTVSVLLNTGSPGSAGFAAKADFGTGSDPQFVAIGDIDGDGKPDLAVANLNSASVSLFRNTSSTGTISFAAKTDLTTGSSPIFVGLGDINGDGKPDLTVANNNGATVSVLPNTGSAGNISFAAKTDFATGAGPYSVAIGDLDGDGKPDLAVANIFSNTVSVLRNTPLFAPTAQAGNVTFANTTTTATTISWTNGNGASRAVFMAAASSGSPAPVDLTAYNANAAFGAGNQAGASGWYCVYNGTGSTVNVTGLTASTTYQAMVVEYNGTGSLVAYLTTPGTGNPAGITTPTTITSIIPASTSPSRATTLNFTVTFADALTTPPSTGDFTLTGTATGTINSITGSGTTYDVKVTNVSGNGTLELDMTSGSDASPTISNVPFTGNAYTIDNTPPTASPITFSSNDPNPAIAYPGETVTLSFTTSEQVLPPMVNIAGTSVQANSPDNIHFTASYMIQPADLPDANGNVPYSISIADHVLNTTNYASTNAGIANVALRQIPPALSGTAPAQPLAAVSGMASPGAGFNVSGDHMQTYVMVNAPNGFEISTDNLNFGGSTTTGGPGTFHSMLYIRLVAGDAAGSYSGNITLNSLNATEVDLPVTGSVTPQPTMVVAITAASPTPTNATTLDYTVTFAAALTTPPSTGDFTLTGTATGTINSVSGSGTTYDVNVTNVGGNGTLELDMTGGSDASPTISNVPFAGGSYTIDNTAPTLAYLFYEVNSRISSTVAGVGRTVSLSFDTNEPIQTATVTIAGHTVTASNTGKGWEASYTMTSGDTEGRVPFSLTTTDLAGNSSSYTDVSQGDDVEFDMTPPTATISAPSVASILTNSPGTVTYTITYADANFNTSNLTTAGVTLNTISGNATGNAVVSGSGTSYTVTISNITGVGSLGITLAGGYATDFANNADVGAGPSATFNVLGSNNAYLSTLLLVNPTAVKTIVPGPDAVDYTASVGNATTSIEVVPTTNVSTSTVTVNNATVTSGSASLPIALSVGTNTITTIVTAQDGVTKKTYVITVTRAPSNNAYLSTLLLVNPTAVKTIVPGPDAVDYTASVSNTTTSIEVIPTTNVSTSTVSVNNATVTSGSASLPIALSVGTNTITTVVTAQDGATKKTYVITVTRAPSNNAYLSTLLVVNPTALKTIVPGPDAVDYTASVSNETASIEVTPTTNVTTSRVTVNGTAVLSGSASLPIGLSIGSNTITTVVTAQDGVTTKMYVITVTREALSSNAYLSTLLLVNPTAVKTIVSGPDAVDYTASVGNATTSIEVIPATNVSTSTVTVNNETVTSGSASLPIALSVGANTITTVVTAQDGVTKKTYVITVTRAAGSLNIVYQPVSVSNPTDHPQMMGEEINVHQALSPNGDGVNDFLVIENIAHYPDNKLQIMNRSGQLVFEARSYDNSSKVFDGHSNKNGQMQLPGTYFYSLDYTVNGVEKHKTGFIVLKY